MEVSKDDIWHGLSALGAVFVFCVGMGWKLMSANKARMLQNKENTEKAVSSERRKNTEEAEKRAQQLENYIDRQENRYEKHKEKHDKIDSVLYSHSADLRILTMNISTLTKEIKELREDTNHKLHLIQKPVNEILYNVNRYNLGAFKKNRPDNNE